jgi:2-iminobutanoate/2-iminopropanoate deaminase
MTIAPGKRIVHSDQAPKAIGPYSQAVIAEKMVFTAGQIGLNPATAELVEGGITAQTRQVLTNLAHVLQAADSALELAVKTTVYLTDMKDFAAMNEVYAEFLAQDPPARSTVAVAGLPRGALIEMDVAALVRGAQAK